MRLIDADTLVERINALYEWCDTIKQIPKAEPLKMRDANSEEIKNTNDYLKSISKPTGIHFEEE